MESVLKAYNKFIGSISYEIIIVTIETDSLTQITWPLVKNVISLFVEET